MKIQDMLANYYMRRESRFSELKQKFNKVISSFEEAAERIPEDEVYQSIASIISEDEDCRFGMGFYLREEGIRYELHKELYGKIEINNVEQEINDLVQYINNEYKRTLSFEYFTWDLKTRNFELAFRILISEQESVNLEENYFQSNREKLLESTGILLMSELYAALPMRITMDFGTQDKKLIICIESKL